MRRRAGARVGDDKARDGQVANRAFYAAVGVGLEGDGDVLGIWGPPAAEGARHWPSVLAELKNRGVRDVLPRVRRAEGSARRGRGRLAGGSRADVHHPPDAQHVPVRVQGRLGRLCLFNRKWAV